ncbi:MAG: aldehyde dehydrogenase family protein, partial [Acidobacteria bacterium]
PIGVVAVITSWCFPLAVPVGLVAAALAAGNTAVLKPSEETPLLAARVVELLLQAGVPPGVLSLVHGTGEEVGAPLVRHPEVGLVAFSGSADVAREVGIACAAEQKRALIDAQGREALLVLEDADPELVVTAVTESFGPRARGRPVLHVVTQGRAGREVQARLVEAVAALRPGDGLQPETTVPPLINDRHLKRLQAYVRVAVKEGAKLLCGGEVCREGDCRRGFFYTPTVLADLRADMRVAQDQVAGPLAALLPTDRLDDAVAATNQVATGSAVTICGRDVGRALHAAARLRADTLRINVVSGDLGDWQQGLGADRPRLLDRFSRWRALALDAPRPAAPEGGRREPERPRA